GVPPRARVTIRGAAVFVMPVTVTGPPGTAGSAALPPGVAIKGMSGSASLLFCSRLPLGPGDHQLERRAESLLEPAAQLRDGARLLASEGNITGISNMNLFQPAFVALNRRIIPSLSSCIRCDVDGCHSRGARTVRGRVLVSVVTPSVL